jgi:hypothetical protein
VPDFPEMRAAKRPPTKIFFEINWVGGQSYASEEGIPMTLLQGS